MFAELPTVLEAAEALKNAAPAISPSASGDAVMHNGGYIPSPAGTDHDHSHSDHHHPTGTVPEDAFSSIGLALVLGFIFMLLVDQCSRSGASRDLESSTTYSTKRSFTATLGLVVHAAGEICQNIWMLDSSKENFFGFLS